jgi:hypothetical protein
VSLVSYDYVRRRWAITYTSKITRPEVADSQTTRISDPKRPENCSVLANSGGFRYQQSGQFGFGINSGRFGT